MAALDHSTSSLPHTNGNGIHHDHDDLLDSEPSPSTFDSSIVRNYLNALLPALLGTSTDELWSLFEDDFEERVGRFASEGNGVMYVTKIKHDLGGASFLPSWVHLF
jgi:hypothetical protein